jgi:hypothetical protein
MNWLCRARLETADVSGLELEARELVAASETAGGEDDDSTFERKEILATILLGTTKFPLTDTDADRLDEARDLICEVLEVCEDGDRNVILHARAQTTLICILALQGRFNDASTEIENTVLVMESLQQDLGADYVEIERFRRTRESVALLQKLTMQGGEGQMQTDLVRERIARRWNPY